MLAVTLEALGDAAGCQGAHEEAAWPYTESLDLVSRLDSPGSMTMALTNLGHVASASGDAQSAHAHLLTGLALSHQVGDVGGWVMAKLGGQREDKRDRFRALSKRRLAGSAE